MKVGNSKKVCILTSVHPVFDTRIFHKQARTLVNAGYDVSLIAQHSKSEIVDGVKIIPLPKPKNRFKRIFFLTRKAYKLAAEQKADIYHFHDPELIPWMLKLKKKTGAKIIYDIHEDYPKQILSKEWIPLVLRFPIAHIYNFFEKLAIKLFDVVIRAGSDIRPKNTKIITIKNYPFTEIAAEDISVFKNNLKKFSYIYIGSISRDRCIKEILQSLEFIYYYWAL